MLRPQFAQEVLFAAQQPMHVRKAPLRIQIGHGQREALQVGFTKHRQAGPLRVPVEPVLRARRVDLPRKEGRIDTLRVGAKDKERCIGNSRAWHGIHPERDAVLASAREQDVAHLKPFRRSVFPQQARAGAPVNRSRLIIDASQPDETNVPIGGCRRRATEVNPSPNRWDHIRKRNGTNGRRHQQESVGSIA